MNRIAMRQAIVLALTLRPSPSRTWVPFQLNDLFDALSLRNGLFDLHFPFNCPCALF